MRGCFILVGKILFGILALLFRSNLIIWKGEYNPSEDCFCYLFMLKKTGKFQKVTDISAENKTLKAVGKRKYQKKVDIIGSDHKTDNPSLEQKDNSSDKGRILEMRVHVHGSEKLGKNLLMWSVISLVMVVVFIFWGLNLRARVATSIEQGSTERNDLASFSSDLGAKINEMKEQMEALREYASTTEASRIEASDLSRAMMRQLLQASSSSIMTNSSTTTTIETGSTTEAVNIKELKEKLTDINPEESGQN